MNTLIIFTLLVCLMLTGMPISISLGLTVLTFLFTLTDVPIESVALKLFTGIEKFEIMAIPFFILAGNFLTHGVDAHYIWYPVGAAPTNEVYLTTAFTVIPAPASALIFAMASGLLGRRRR